MILVINFFSPLLGLNPPSRDLGTEPPRALPMDQQWEHFCLIKFLVECNINELPACLTSLRYENILFE